MLLHFARLSGFSRLLSPRSVAFLTLFFGVTKVSLHAAPLDTVIFGDAASEAAHALVAPSTEILTGALGQPARRALPLSPVDIYGGSLSFTVNVDPVRRNYVTVKLWGADDGDIQQGRLYLYVPSGGVDYQVGYRHEGDYAPLNVTGTKPPLPGRFFYSTTLLPLAMTQGKSSVTLKIVSAGRLYGLGSGGPPSGNYQYVMDRPSRGLYRAYTHVDPFLNPTGEVQGAAPATTTRPSPGQEVMGPGGAFFNGVTNRINNRLNAAVSVPGFSVDDVAYLAKSYSVPGLVSTNQAAVVDKVIAVIDAYATANYAGTIAPSSDWGGAFGELGYAMSLLSAQLAPSLDTVVNYGAAGGSKPRRVAWGDMLYASREYGRLNRDGRSITNQGLIADESIYKANKGLLVLGDARAFAESAAQRYLREACGLQPWLGSDLPAGGSSLKYGSSYAQVTTKGLTREQGYVGNSYGEMAYHAVRFFLMTGDSAFRDQAAKMGRARAAFRRPAIEVSGTNYYPTMEAIGLLAWRGVGESDGEFADSVVYGDTSEWARGLHLAAVTLDPTLIGYAKQMLADNQYFIALTRDARYYADIGALEAFADYTTISSEEDSGTRLPMSEGQPDFAWSDEEDRILALKHGTDRLWIAPYWQAKGGTGINGIARFHFSTPTYDQYGVLETVPQFTASGSYQRPATFIDKPEQTQWGPPNPPTQAYGNEILPLGATPPGASDDGPFRGKADFYAFRFGSYLMGLNAHPTNTYTLKTPADFTTATDLITGGTVTGTINVTPASTVALYLPTSVDLAPIPTAPLYVGATGSAGGMNVAWSLSSGATSYTVKRATSLNGPYTVLAAGVTGTSYTDSAVTAGNNYYYQITAVNSNGESYDSMKAAGVTRGLPAPWSDSDIGTVTTAGYASYNAGTYSISGAGTDIGGTADGIHFGYQPLTGDGVLIARVASRINGGSADKVGLMIREDLTAGAKSAAVLLSSAENYLRFPYRSTVGGTSTYLNFPAIPATVPRWLKLQRAGNTFTGYASVDGVAWTQAGSVTFAMNSTVQVGFVVCSRNAAVLDTTTYDNVSLTPSLVPAPTALTASASPSQAALSWTAATGATSYTVQRSLTSGGPYTLVATGLATTSYTDTGLTNTTTYYYTVTASNASRTSLPSNEVSVLPLPPAPPPAPATVTATGGSGQIALTWTASTGATSYAVKRGASSGGPYAVVTSGIATTSYIDTGLSTGTTYYYVVSAFNTYGESADAGPASATTFQLPGGWSSQNVGTAIGGGGTFDAATSTFSVSGAGSDIGGTSENFQFTYTTLAGDGTFIARLATRTIGGAVNDKVGIMMRESTAANARMVIALIDASTGLARFGSRGSTAGSTAFVNGPGVTVPRWFRLQRAGNVFTGSVSADGATWTPISSATVAMTASPILVGFAVCARDAALDTSTFDNVDLSSAAPVITSAPSAAATVYQPFTYAITANNHPTTFAATGLPAGLTIDTVTGVISGTPTAAGTSSIGLSATNGTGRGSALLTITIAKAPAALSLGALTTVYDGTAKSVTASTTPAGLAVTFSYNGDTTSPVNAGSYDVVATVVDFNYTGSATGTLVVSKAPATVALDGLTTTYDGTPKAATATTTPAGMAVALTYDGSATAPTNAGGYAVAAAVVDPNYTGSATGTLVIAKSGATITLTSLTQTYDGTPKSATATTSPAGLAVVCLYDGKTEGPIYPGPHAVIATIDDANYSASVTGSLVIGTTALVQHAPSITGIIDGSVQILLPESLTLNGSGAISGDLLVPGRPTVSISSQAIYGGTIEGPGGTVPSNFTITLSSGSTLKHVVRGVDPISLPTVSGPAAPLGTRDVTLNSTSASIGDLTTLRNLTLNSGAGVRAIPAGAYGTFTANGGGFSFGTRDSTEPAIYNLQGLRLNGGAQIQVVGPVLITLAKGPSLNGNAGTSDHPEWLILRVASENVVGSTDNVTLNGNGNWYGSVIAPTGTVTINGNSQIVGSVICDRLVVNGNGLLDGRW